MSNQEPMKCYKCGQPIKFQKGVVNKWGKPQQLNQDGTEHWKTCTARAQNTQQQFQGKEKSDTYVAKEYIQQPEEPFVARPQQSSAQDSEAIKKLGEDIKTMNVQIANIQQYQVGIDGLLAKVVQKLDLLLSASGVDEALGPKPLG